MAKKHEKMLTIYGIKEMQIKTTLIFHLIPVRIAIIKNTTNNRYWRGCGEKETLIHCWWGCKLVQPLWKKNWRIFKNLNIDLSYDPSIPKKYTQRNATQVTPKASAHLCLLQHTIHNSQVMETAKMPHY
jgi:hypothetical protein